MIAEQRTYTLQHGKMNEYLERFEAHALPLLKEHLGHLLGFFVSEIGPLNQVVHLWMFDSLADREQRRAALEADPRWHDFKATNRGTFVAQEVRIFRPASFCPARNPAHGPS